MIDRVEAQFDMKPERLIGDTAYGTTPMLAWMVEEKDIEPHVPVNTEVKAPYFPKASTTMSAIPIRYAWLRFSSMNSTWPSWILMASFQQKPADLHTTLRSC